jgi:hypothetical protein
MTSPLEKHDIRRPEEFDGLFSGAVSRVGDLVDKIVDEYNTVVRQVNKKAPELGFTMYWISIGMNEARKSLKEFLPVAQYLIKHATPVLSLYDSASQWITQVEGPISTLSNTINTSEPNLAHWSDDAYTSYDRVRTKQGQAATATAARAKFVAGWLASLAESNLKIATAVLNIVSGLAGNLAQAVVDTGAVISIPLAIDTLAKSVGDIVSKGLEQLVALADKFAEDISEYIDLLGQINDNSDLPDGKWPKLAPH